MDRTQARLQLRITLSRREKARAACQECDAALAQGLINQECHDERLEGYQAYLQKAEEDVHSLRKMFHRKSEELGGELRQALEDERRLHASVQAKRTPKRAAKKSMAYLAGHVLKLREAIAEYNVLHAAQSAADAGGYIDQPMEGYEPILPAPAEAIAPRPRPSRLSRIRVPRPVLVLTIAIVAALVISALVTHRLLPGGGGPHLVARLASSDADALDIALQNRESAPITIRVPRLNTLPDQAQYGVTVHVLEEAGPWRLAPLSAECWTYQGLPLTTPRTFTVDPGFVIELGLDLTSLNTLGIAPQAIEIRLEGERGRPVSTFQTSVPTDPGE